MASHRVSRHWRAGGGRRRRRAGAVGVGGWFGKCTPSGRRIHRAAVLFRRCEAGGSKSAAFAPRLNLCRRRCGLVMPQAARLRRGHSPLVDYQIGWGIPKFQPRAPGAGHLTVLPRAQPPPAGARPPGRAKAAELRRVSRVRVTVMQP
jgi:hypothetical protein